MAGVRLSRFPSVSMDCICDVTLHLSGDWLTRKWTFRAFFVERCKCFAWKWAQSPPSSRHSAQFNSPDTQNPSSVGTNPLMSKIIHNYTFRQNL